MAAGANGIRAGLAYVELFLHDTLESGLKKAEMKLQAFGASVGAIGQSMVGFGAAALAPAAAAIKVAGDMEAVNSQFKIVFGDSAESVEQWGDRVGKTVGRSKRQMREFLAGSQDLFVPLGFDSKTAVDMSKTLTELAIDIGSFKGKADADVMRDLQAAMTGSSEVMKKYGVIVGENEVKQELFNQGIDPKNATNQQKVLARLNIILAGTAAAHGNAAATSDEFLNRLKRAKAIVSDAAATIGSALLPAANQLLASFTETATVISAWAESNSGAIVFAVKAAAAITALGAGMMILGKAATGIATLTKIMRSASVAVRALGVAFKFLAANPAVAAIVGITLAVGAAVVAIDKLQTHTAKLSDSMTQMRTDSDKQRQVDMDRMARLKQLADREKLNADEMKEAGNIITRLQGRYGDLGITLDETTGKLTGVAAGHMKVVAAMKKAALAQIDAEIAERQRNIDELHKEQSSTANALLGRFKHGRIRGLGDDIIEQQRYMRALQMRRRAMQEGDEDALTGKAKLGGSLKDRLANGAAAAQEVNEWTRKVHQLELQQIEDEHQRRIALIDERYDYELKRARQAGAAQETLDNIERARKLEIAAVEAASARQAAEQRKQQIEEETQNKAAAQMADKNRSDTIQELRLRTTLEGQQLEKALLQLEKQRSIEAAQKAGERLDLVRQEYALREQLLSAQSDIASGAPSTRGTFNAMAIRGLESGNLAQRTAVAAEKQVTVAEKIERNTRDIGNTFT